MNLDDLVGKLLNERFGPLPSLPERQLDQPQPDVTNTVPHGTDQAHEADQAHSKPDAMATRDPLDEAARKLVADWPPLTQTQRARLAVLLAGRPTAHS